MLKARDALQKIYADMLDKNVVLLTLKEMRKRGLPKHLYEQYLKEAIEIGIIPVPGKSKIDGRVMRIEDILTKKDVLKELDHNFTNDNYFYGVG